MRRAFDAQEASLLAVTGAPGVGKSALVRVATEGFPTVHHRCPPLPDPSQRSALAATLRRALPPLERAAPPADAETPDWPRLLGWLERAAPPGSTPLILVLDDAHRLAEARSRLGAALGAFLSRAQGLGHPIHIVLVGPSAALPEFEDGLMGQTIALAPLTYRAALPLLPGDEPRDKLEAYGALGGLPGNLRHVDTNTSLTANIRRLLLDADGPLADSGTAQLEQRLQTPSRYAAILSALSWGEAEWNAIHSGVSDLTTSGQVAPYLRRLEEMGMVEVRRSLDARPKGRSRRYRITDPLLAFWYRMATLTEWGQRSPEDTLPTRFIREAVEVQAAAVFPSVCRQYMTHDAMEHLGANARECGSLWGPHYHMNVSGILTSGAVFYGLALWNEELESGHLRTLDGQIRETRYGFGREARLRMLFTDTAPSPQMARAVARRHEARVVTVEDLAGTDQAE